MPPKKPIKKNITEKQSVTRNKPKSTEPCLFTKILHFLKDEKPLKFTRTCLYILKNFNFISEVNYGDKYYVSTENNNGFIKYYFSEDPQKIIGIKTTSILSSTLLDYYREHDKSRFGAITQ